MERFFFSYNFNPNDCIWWRIARIWGAASQSHSQRKGQNTAWCPCSLPQQRYMAEVFKEVFGPLLLTDVCSVVGIRNKGQAGGWSSASLMSHFCGYHSAPICCISQ
jgi:hypothetical protein